MTVEDIKTGWYKLNGRVAYCIKRAVDVAVLYGDGNETYASHETFIRWNPKFLHS